MGGTTSAGLDHNIDAKTNELLHGFRRRRHPPFIRPPFFHYGNLHIHFPTHQTASTTEWDCY
jgi:hypothetical protein